MDHQRKWLEDQLSNAEQAMEDLKSGLLRDSESTGGLTEEEASDLEYHYFVVARTMRKILDSKRHQGE